MRAVPIALDGTLPACYTVHSNDTFRYISICTEQYNLRQLDYMLPNLVSVQSKIHCSCILKYNSKYVLNYTSAHAYKDVPNCTRSYGSRQLGSTLPSTHSRGQTLTITLDYMLPCMLLCTPTRDFLSCMCLVSEGSSQVVGGWWPLAGRLK